MQMHLTYVKQNINNAVLKGVHAMPSKDITSDGANSFAIGRYTFLETAQKSSPETKRWYGESNRDASQIVANRRVAHIGMGSLNSNGGDMSFTSNNETNTIHDALARVRGSGYVAPPKSTHKVTNAPVPYWRPQRTTYPIKDMTPVSRSHKPR
jgi:hypothetical protein